MADKGITIEAGLLAKAMKRASAVVEGRNTIPILANVRLIARGDSLELLTTNLDVELRQQVVLATPGDLSTTVDARRLAALAGAVDGGAQISLTQDGGRLIVKSGRSRWQVPSLPIDDFPALPFDDEPQGVEFPAGALAAAIGRVLWSVCDEVSRSHISGPLLHVRDGKCVLAATNGHTLVREVTGQAGPADAPDLILMEKFCHLLQQLAGELDAAAPVTLAWDAKKVRAAFGALVLTGKAIDSTFPDYTRVIPPNSEAITVDPAQLRAAVRRVQLVCNEKTRCVKVAAEPGKLTISASDPEGGTACEEVPAMCERTYETGFNAKYLDQMLAVIGGDSVDIHQQDAGSPARFTRAVADAATGVVMPMRV